MEHVDELFDDNIWEHYGFGKDPRCANCMMHGGFESATIFTAAQSPKDWATLIKSGAVHKGGITAANEARLVDCGGRHGGLNTMCTA